MGKSDNIKPLNEYLQNVNLTPNKYLEMVRFVANHRGYDGDKLTLCDDGKHKLNYDGVKFGRIGYNDKIIYTWLEHNNKIPEGTAKLKYTNYRKRAEKVMKATNNRFSPSSLSYYILW